MRTLVVAYDFSPHADAALETAVSLSKQCAADLHLLHVVDPPTVTYPSIPSMELGNFSASEIPPVPTRNAALDALDDLARAIRGACTGALETHVVEGRSIDRSIVDFCQEIHADLLVMGTHGRTGLAHVFLGSVAERTIGQAPCPVLVIPAPESDRARDRRSDVETSASA